jgi:putative addiction module component (TIGR02574 family)
MATLDQVTRQAQALSPLDRLRLVEAVLQDLEPVDPEVEKKWAAEGDARYEAFKRGELEAKDWNAARDEFKR